MIKKIKMLNEILMNSNEQNELHVSLILIILWFYVDILINVYLKGNGKERIIFWLNHILIKNLNYCYDWHISWWRYLIPG